MRFTPFPQDAPTSKKMPPKKLFAILSRNTVLQFLLIYKVYLGIIVGVYCKVREGDEGIGRVGIVSGV